MLDYRVIRGTIALFDSKKGVIVMANIKFFVDGPNGQTFESKRADYDQGYRAMPRIFNAEAGQWERVTRIVEYKSNPSRHECDDRCTHATGRVMKCECSCGGKNHGKCA